MTQYNISYIKLSNSQLNKLKSEVKNETKVVSRLSFVNLCKALVIYLSTDIKLSKTQLPNMIQAGGFLGRFLVSY